MPVKNGRKTVCPPVLSRDGIGEVTLSFDVEGTLQDADIVLAMDCSGSMEGKPLQCAVAAAKTMVKELAESSGDPEGRCFRHGCRMGIVRFSDCAFRSQELTVHTDGLCRALSGLKGEGNTNHQAAFQIAGQMLSSRQSGRKILILFTDGLSTGGCGESSATWLKSRGVEIYCIGLGISDSVLCRWAGTPSETHVAAVPNPEHLEKAFRKIQGEIVRACVRDVRVAEQLNPEFTIAYAEKPSHGQIVSRELSGLVWKIDRVQGPAHVSLTFGIRYVGKKEGVCAVNRCVHYSDRDCNELTFPNPQVTIAKDMPCLPDACPQPVEAVMETCQEAVCVRAPDTPVSSPGRMVYVDALIKNVCPGRRVAVAVQLTETMCGGEEKPVGMRTLTIPPRGGEGCEDVMLRCIRFVVPDSCCSLCKPRSFRVRVYANYLDMDFLCCKPGEVSL